MRPSQKSQTISNRCRNLKSRFQQSYFYALHVSYMTSQEDLFVCLFLILVLSYNERVLASIDVKKITIIDFVHGFIFIIQ